MTDLHFFVWSSTFDLLRFFFFFFIQALCSTCLFTMHITTAVATTMLLLLILLSFVDLHYAKSATVPLIKVLC